MPKPVLEGEARGGPACGKIMVDVAFRVLYRHSDNLEYVYLFYGRENIWEYDDGMTREHWRELRGRGLMDDI